MILQALKEYYDRKAEMESIAPEGWIEGGIDFLIELDGEGRYKGVACLQEMNGKKTTPKPMLVPCIGKQAMKHTNSGKDANLLWDNASFILGLGEKGDLRLRSVIDAIDSYIGKGKDRQIDAVITFLSNGLADRSIFQPLIEHSEYGETLSGGQVKLSFHIAGSNDHMVFNSDIVRNSLISTAEPGDGSGAVNTGTCLITGKTNVPIELTHTVIKNVWGAQTAGACIVGFNKESFLSYGKEQGLNAPISRKAAMEYVKSLNSLLDSEQRMQVGDASTVFWSARKTRFESDFAMFFKEPERDNPDTGVEKIRNLFSSPATGAYLDDEGDERFFVLGLAPNAARLSIRFWEIGTIKEFAARIRRHFDDTAIVKPAKEPEYYSLWRLLVNIATQDKSENIPPNLAGDFMRAILVGTPYPETVLQAALRRIRSDTEYRVKPVRASLIKAYLNRYLRTHPQDGIKEITMALDVEQPSVGYQLGRLFAVLEKIQEEANPSLNATIRERYYGSACSSPVTVFGTLMRLKNHHEPPRVCRRAI